MFGLLGNVACSMPVVGAAHPEVGGALLLLNPLEIAGHFRVGADSIQGIQLFGQGGL